MQWSTYKALCDRPDYWSRWMLDQCLELLQVSGHEHLRVALQQAIDPEAVPVPADHKGPPATLMYQVQLEPTQRREILMAISQAHSRELTTSGTSARGLGGFVEAWREFAMYNE